MNCFERHVKSIGSLWNEDEVYVIRHQTIGNYLDVILLRELVEQIQVCRKVPGCVKYTLAAVAALGHVMRDTREHNASLAWHPRTLASLTRINCAHSRADHRDWARVGVSTQR